MTFAKKITKSNGSLVTREVFVVFTAFFHWCVSKKWLTHNPIDDALREYMNMLKIEEKQLSIILWLIHVVILCLTSI